MCTLNSACNGLVCDFIVFSMEMWVLPCAHPPVVRMKIISDKDVKMFDEVLAESTRIQGQNYSIQVTIKSLDGEFGLQVKTVVRADG